MLKSAAFGVGIALWSTAALSQNFVTGNALHAACRGNKLEAQGYVTGFVDTFALLSTAAGLRMCLPANLRSEQATDIACKYLALNPETRHHSGASQVFNAILGTFPCDK